MANPSYLQTSFLGGQWAITAQGRADEDAYRTALNVSFNALPIEVGAHTRRPGTVAPSTTRKGLPGIMREFHLSQNQPFDLEFTDNVLRVWAGHALLSEFEHTIASVSSGNPAVISAPNVGSDWNTGDTIQIAATLSVPGTSPVGVSPLLSRQLQLGTKSGTTFQLLDPVTGAGINGAAINAVGWTLTGAKVVEFATTYVFGAAWKGVQLRVVQNQDLAYILVPGFAPALLQNVGTDTEPTFAWTESGSLSFLDGPYLDPPTDGSTLTPSAQSGTIDLTASAITSINNGQGFASTDVGRFVRLFSEPLNWSAVTNYTAGQKVRFETGSGPAYYQALVANHGIEPDLDNGTNWAISTTAAAWTWGIIETIISPSEVSATLQGSRTDVYQQPLAGGSLLYTNPINVWRLGSWSQTTGWPTCGGFHEGRFWFGGPANQEFDATMSQEDLDFTPTLLDGTVADNNGISEKIKSKQDNTIFWIQSTEEALILGTQGGEWVVRASTLGEAITPTSITAKQATKYGCANAEPRDTGLSFVFVQRFTKQVYEYLADVYSRKFSGTNIARRARDLTNPGVLEIAYTFENAPVLWARVNGDKLIGCTYKRESPFSTQPASFFGWHYHTLGSQRAVQSIAAGPSADGSIDTLAMITEDLTTGIHYVEFMQPVFEENDLITEAWFVDSGITPAAAAVSGNDVVFYGLNYLNGETLTAWVGGVDAGDYVVTNGTITVPVDGTANPLLTLAALEALNVQGGFGTLGVNIQITPPGDGFFSPFGTAQSFTSTHNAPSHAGQAWFDWDSNVVYIATGDGTHNYFDVFNISTRSLEASWQQDTLLNGIQAANCLGYDHNIYYEFSDSTYKRFNTATQTSDLSVSYIASGFGPASVIGPAQTAAGTNYLIAIGLNSGQGGGGSAPWWAINMTAQAVVSGGTGSFLEGFSSVSPGNVLLCRGPIGPPGPGPTATIYAAAYGAPGTPWTGPSQIGLYAIVVEDGPSGGEAAATRLGTILGSNVVGAWTSVTLASQPVYDETDGNILMNVTGSDSTNRLIKVNSQTAAVMWVIDTSNFDFGPSRIRGGRLTYQGTSQFLYINTLTGTFTTQAVSGLAGGSFSTDDRLGIYVQQIASSGTQLWNTFGPAAGGGEITPAVVYNAPAALGFNYISQGQILRAILPQETLDPSGPGLGKTRRPHMYSALLSGTQGVKVGTNFTAAADAGGGLRKAVLQSAGRTQTLAANVLFSDVIQDTLDGDADFHGMWCWQTDRPYPTTVVSVEVFLSQAPR